MRPNLLPIYFYCITGLFLTACESGTQPPPVTTGGKQNTILSQLATQQQLTQDTIALVNGKPIQKKLLDYYIQYKKAENPQQDVSEKTDELTEQLINIEVLAQYAEKKGLHKDSRIVNRLEFERKNTLANIILNRALGTYNISEKKLKNEYNKQYANKKILEYSAKHILVLDKSTALDVIRKLQTGENFSDLAEEYSTSPSSSVGGALEWFTEERIDKDFMDAVRNLQKGKFTNIPVKTKHGWNIILLDDTRTAIPDLESVRDKLESTLFENYIKTYIRNLRNKANIEKITQ